MSLKSFILNILFPLECLGCKTEGGWLCEKCFRQLKFNNKKYPLKAPNLDEIFIAGDYDDKILSDLIKKLKFNFIDNIALILGRFLNLFWSGIIFSRPELKNKEILLIPLPLSKKRENWRGFNQAELIARSFNNEYNYLMSLDLKKIKNTKAQSDLNENERAKNIKDCFVWNGKNLKDKIIILIDDVVTTGATLNEAAGVLKKAGAQKIYGLVVAKG
ncbi:MAG: ComF family protein [Patescibacteria group bacterium]